MRRLVRIDSVGAVLQYVERSLSSGRSLSSIVLQKVRSNRIEVLTLLRTTEEEAAQLEWGHDFAWSEFNDWVVDACRAHLEGDPRAVVVIEDGMFRRGDPCVERAQGRRVYVDNDVLFFLDWRDSNEYAISTTIADAASVGTTNVFLASSSDELPGGASLSESQLHSLAQSAKRIFIKAYDDEGYVEVNLH